MIARATRQPLPCPAGAGDGRAGRERPAAPEVESEQRLGAGAHGVADVGGVVDNLTGSPLAVWSVAHAPIRAGCQRNIEFFGDMVVIGIVDIWAEDEKTTGDRVILEMATRAEHFQPAVIVDELLAEIGGGVGLAPVEVATAIGKQTSERDEHCCPQSPPHEGDGRGKASHAAGVLAPAWPNLCRLRSSARLPRRSRPGSFLRLKEAHRKPCSLVLALIWSMLSAEGPIARAHHWSRLSHCA